MIVVPIGEIIVGGIATGTAIEFLKELIKWVKDKKAKIFYPSEQKKFKKIIEKIDSSPELKDNAITLEITGNYNIVNIGGNYGIVKKEDIKEIIDVLEESKEKETEQKINLMPTTEAGKFLDYQKTPKYLEKDFSILLPKLKPAYISLICLSIHIEQYYKEDRKDEAEEARRDVLDRYHDFGLKFVNLWSRSYLKNLFSFLLQNPYIPLLNINDRLSEFIEKAESIFFIHPETDYKKTASEVIGLLKIGKPYVAIHSLGSLAGTNALRIIEKVKKAKIPKMYNYHEIEIIKKREKYLEVSKIWYRGAEGLSTYLLIKDTIA